MSENKFRFKKGADVEAILEALVDKRLKALQEGKEEEDKDFELLELEEEVKSAKPKVSRSAKPRILKKKKKSKLKIEEKRLVIDDPEEKAEFDEALLAFKEARGQYNQLDKEVKAGRNTILTTMDGNLLYESDQVILKIAETPQSSVNAEAVVEALVDLESEDLEEIKAGVQEILDMARMGILSIGKTDFDRWIKARGQDARPFLISRSPKKVIRVSSK